MAGVGDRGVLFRLYFSASLSPVFFFRSLQFVFARVAGGRGEAVDS